MFFGFEHSGECSVEAGSPRRTCGTPPTSDWTHPRSGSVPSKANILEMPAPSDLRTGHREALDGVRTIVVEYLFGSHRALTADADLQTVVDEDSPVDHRCVAG